MPDNPIICPSCGEENPAGTKTCGFCTLPLTTQSGRTPDAGTRIINDNDGFKPNSTVFIPGSLIANRYEVLLELGRGGMGAVYLVADEKLARKEMALKIISPALVGSPEMQKRFVQEVLAARELFHENIIRVHHLDEYRGLQFFTMEYLPGKSLREVMAGRFASGQFFSIEESTAVLFPVLSALAHAHSKNVIHRDLKPENIIINGDLPDITVKVLDFGLARIMSPSRLTSTAVAMGTAYYMSPEQLSGRIEVDHRTDLFAVGVILYELLTGDIPTGRFKLPGELIDGLTSGIDEVVERSLATKPMDRFQAASEFDTAINQLSDTKATAIEAEIKRKQAEEKEKQGYATHEKWVSLSRNTTLPVTLKKIETGSIRVTGKPSGSEVRVDGRLAGTLPTTIHDVSPGTYTISISSPGHDLYESPVAVRAGQASDVTATLTPLPKEVTTSLGMKFMYIEPGAFIMGSPENEPGRRNNERQHRVTLTRGYYMQTTPVTQGQWKAVMGNNSSHFSNCGDNCPVERVSCNDTQDFIRRLNQLEGGNMYCLPTEAEWEYAARAGSTTAYHFGNSESNLSRYAWYDVNSGSRTHPVEQMLPNAWGLYDVHGNVWEWVEDYVNYPTSEVTDPTGPSSGASWVLRGGGWSSPARYCRSANRVSHGPGFRGYNFGFRLVRHPGQPPVGRQ